MADPASEKRSAADQTQSEESPKQGHAEAARAMAYSAERAFERRDYQEAAQSARAAHRLVPAPTLALLEARALEKLGQWNEAIARYRIAAGPTPLPINDVFREAQKEAKRSITALEKKIPLLKIAIREDTAPRTEVRVDGIRLPEESLRVWLPQDPGMHVVSFLDGSGSKLDYEIHLEPHDRRPLMVGPPPPRENVDPRVPAGWTSLAVGGVALATGAGLTVRANNSGHQTSRDLSTAAYIVGISGVAAGSVLLWVWPLFDDSEERWTASVGPRSLSVKRTF